MPSLEAKIPPPAVAAGLAVAMWGIAQLTPSIHLSNAVRFPMAWALLLIGLGFSAGGVIAFRRARTTVNPTRPDQASSLVTSGVYRVTRNPMYVGLLCGLVAWSVFLSSAWALLGPIAFVPYIGRFQIAPEERALEEIFGAEYTNYQGKVRRWL